ncbi:MAG: DNA repair protein RadA [Acidimicrobiales bacterium]
MATRRTIFRCSDCGAESVRWVGRCPGCAAWNTLVEGLERAPAASCRSAPAAAVPAEAACLLSTMAADGADPRPTGVSELDRVLGGGLVPGSVTLLAGEPGVGKSTLLIQLASSVANEGGRVLYVTAEESHPQVLRRAQRLGLAACADGADGVWLASTTSLPEVIAHLDAVRPDVVLVDSIQTIHDPELGFAPGTVVQVRECAHRLVTLAKTRGVATVLVGHVTKEGAIAGPRVLEHVVDTVLSFDGDRHHALRLLRTIKHRFGSTAELGLFEMTDLGLIDVPDASGLFLGDRQIGVAGSAVAPTLEGTRPLLVELQALVAPSELKFPRRSAQGLDGGRLAVLLAVIEQRVGLPVGKSDVFTLAVGGVRVAEPGADLSLVLAIVSSFTDHPLPEDLVACGEVGLGGELRQVSQTSRRLAEAHRLGFAQALVPVSAPEPPAGQRVLRAATVAEAIGLVGLDVGIVRRGFEAA